MAMSELPPGFVLDQPPDIGLPPGFVLDHPKASTATGIAKSLGVGAAEGAIGIAGLPDDIAELGARGIDYATRKIGGMFGVDVAARAPRETKYGAEQIRKAVEDRTGEFYKPQGRAEQIANTAGQFLPAVIGGPEAMAIKLATRVAAPTIGSEAAGALTNDNPYAKAAGALGGAVAGPAAFNRAVRAMRPGAAATEPTVAEIKAASRADYNNPDVTNVRIAPQATERLADTIASDLQHGPNSGFRPTNNAHAPVFQEIENLRSGAPQGSTAGPMPKTVADLDNVRQGLNNLAKERDASGQFTPAATAARRAIGHIDDFLPNLQQADLLAGDASAANQILQRARQNWGAAKRAENVQTIAANAELSAASANSGGNIQNATKQAFKPMLKNNAAKAVGYSPEELAALNQVVRGTWTGSIARGAGNLLGGGGGLGMLVGGAAGYHEGGVPGAIAVGLAGRGLKMVGNRSTLNSVARLDRMLRNRSPEAIRIAAANPQIAQHLPPAAMRRLQALIAADPILSQQIAQPVQADSQ